VVRIRGCWWLSTWAAAAIRFLCWPIKPAEGEAEAEEEEACSGMKTVAAAALTPRPTCGGSTRRRRRSARRGTCFESSDSTDAVRCDVVSSCRRVGVPVCRRVGVSVRRVLLNQCVVSFYMMKQKRQQSLKSVGLPKN
jgi:hypothetical protein